MTPAAIIIRKIATELALLHPFALASKTPVKVGDLDSLMDPGLSSAFHLFKYSVFAGFVLLFILIVGATLVPIGTLLVYTGTYSAPLNGTAVVGMPTNHYYMSYLIYDMWLPNWVSESPSQKNLPAGEDPFSAMVIDMFKGNVLQQAGVVTPTTPILGPVATTNLTYEEDVRYDGIVTYEWASGCEYTDSIDVTEGPDTTFWNWAWNFTFPDGEVFNTDPRYNRLFVANVTTNGSDTTTYYAAMGVVNSTSNMDAALAASSITVLDGIWISRVACRPIFSWKVSTCVWKNSSMTDCYDGSSNNITSNLETEGLDALQIYLSAVPLLVHNEGTQTYDFETVQTALMFDPQADGGSPYDRLCRAPLLSDFDNMYGLVAQSLAALTMAGYYGAAVVPTTGSSPRPVYLVRTYVLAIITTMLILSPILVISILLLDLKKRRPLRRATFLTVANAVRGSRWDTIFFGGCVMPHEALKRSFGGLRVMFGVDNEMGNHVGFASVVTPVQRDVLYAGVSAAEPRSDQ